MSRFTNIQSNIQNQSRIVNSNVLIPESWKTLTLAAGFITFSGTDYIAPQVRKDPFGRVWVRGHLAASSPGAVSQGTVFFTLPAGYRPNAAVQLPVTSINSGVVVGYVAIATNGQVSAYSTNLNSTFISLDAITFPTL